MFLLHIQTEKNDIKREAAVPTRLERDERKMERTNFCSEADRIVDTYSDMVYKPAYAQVKNKNDADDIYQEVFFRYIRKKPVFITAENEKAWFIRVTINCCKNFWSSPFRQHTQALEDNIVFQSEEESVLKPLVKKLPKTYRAVVHLFYYEDMSIAEIGKLLNRKEATVRVQLMRSRKLLRDILEGDKSFVK